MLFVLLTLHGVPAFALDPARTLQQLHHTAWTVKDGAPPDIWALAQGSDGDLWLGTGNGLYRFDGLSFEHLNVSFRSNDITALTALPSGELWIGFFYGGSSVLQDGRFTHYGEHDGMPGGTVFKLVRSRDGALWAACGNGLGRFVKGRWETIGADWNYPAGSANWVLVDAQGTLWVSTGQTVVFLRAGAHAFESTGERSGRAVLAQSADGRIWISDEAGGTRVLPDYVGGHRRLGALLRSPRDGKLWAQRLVFDRDGGLWASESGHGIFRLRDAARLRGLQHLTSGPPGELFQQRQGLTADIVVPILEDREGNIWVGTNLGLNRFRANNVVAESRVPATSPFGFQLAAGDAGAVWIAYANKLDRVDADSARTLSSALPRITCAYRSADGRLWLGGYGNALRVRVADRILNIATPKPARKDDSINAISVDGAGGLWVSFEHLGVFRLADGAWLRNGDRSELPAESAIAAASDAAGGVWLGYRDNRLARIERDRVQRFAEADGLEVGNVITINADARQLLVGGELGLAQFDGRRFRSLTVQRLEVLGGISGIIETASGEIWINGNRGIVRLPAEELRHALDDQRYAPHYDLYDYEDGLPGIAQQSRSGSAAAAADGRLWFATNRGIAWIDPAHIHRNTLAPLVSIRALHTGGRAYLTSTPLQLPASTTEVQIDYDGSSLSIPERVRFRYRLDDVDAQWQDVGARRQAIYTNLGPGAHQFRVIAANEDGVWNDTGASLQFSIAPTFFQTEWFLLACALAATLLLWSVYALRLRQIVTRLKIIHRERLAERERIARELHDTLLQSVQGLILRFQAATLGLPERDPLRASLEDTLLRANQTLAEGRDRVKGLRSANLTGNDLPKAFAQLARELASNDPLTFRITVEGSVRSLQPPVEDELFAIGAEALTNAFRHAAASSVEMELAYDQSELRLRVRDNGIGLAQEILDAGGREGHWGLAGMRERAQRIRARLAIWSKAGVGTEVELRMAAGLAYRSVRRKARRWS